MNLNSYSSSGLRSLRAGFFLINLIKKKRPYAVLEKISNMLRLLALLLVLAQTSLACEDYGGTFRHLTHALYRVITTLWSSIIFFIL